MKNAFTLVELLIVIIIIGILAAMAMPQYQKMVVKAKKAEAYANLDALRKACFVYRTEYGDFSGRPDIQLFAFLGTDMDKQKQCIEKLNKAFDVNLTTDGRFFYVFDRCDVVNVNPDWDEQNIDFSVHAVPFGEDGTSSTNRLTIYVSGNKREGDMGGLQ